MQNTLCTVQSIYFLGFAFAPSDHRSLGVGGLRPYAVTLYLVSDVAEAYS